MAHVASAMLGGIRPVADAAAAAEDDTPFAFAVPAVSALPTTDVRTATKIIANSFTQAMKDTLNTMDDADFRAQMPSVFGLNE